MEPDQRFDASRPLAELIRPCSLSDYVGQEHLLRNGSIANFLHMGYLPSMILFGPPGVGKTTLASIIARETNYIFVELSATDSTVGDLRELLDALKSENGKRHHHGSLPLRVAVFIDEIHRFTSTQQDFLLPFVEAGTFVFIGATTVEPHKRIRRAILSRCQLFQLLALSSVHVERVLRRAALYENIRRKTGSNLKFLSYSDEAFHSVVRFANGDTRTAINFIELISSKFTQEIHKIDEASSMVIDDATVQVVVKSLTKVRFGLQHDESVPLFVQLFDFMNQRVPRDVQVTNLPRSTSRPLVSYSHHEGSLTVRIRVADIADAVSDLESIIDEKEMKKTVESERPDWADHMEYSDDSDVDSDTYSDNEHSPTSIDLKRLDRSKFFVLSAVHTLLGILGADESPLFVLKHLIMFVCMYVQLDNGELPKVMSVLKAMEKSTADSTRLLSLCVERLTALKKNTTHPLMKTVRWLKEFHLSSQQAADAPVGIDCEIVFDDELVEKLLLEPEPEILDSGNNRIPVVELDELTNDVYTLGWESELQYGKDALEHIARMVAQV